SGDVSSAEATLQAQLRVQEIDLDSMKQVNTWQDLLGSGSCTDVAGVVSLIPPEKNDVHAAASTYHITRQFSLLENMPSSTPMHSKVCIGCLVRKEKALASLKDQVHTPSDDEN
ncbi:unnamed protein product, partial [Durusdinium trenchii]